MPGKENVVADELSRNKNAISIEQNDLNEEIIDTEIDLAESLDIFSITTNKKIVKNPEEFKILSAISKLNTIQ